MRVIEYFVRVAFAALLRLLGGEDARVPSMRRQPKAKYR
jgi:hypothetical protein